MLNEGDDANFQPPTEYAEEIVEEEEEDES